MNSQKKEKENPLHEIDVGKNKNNKPKEYSKRTKDVECWKLMIFLGELWV